MIKAAIFDLDGIIIDSEPIQMIAINQVMDQWTIKLSEKDFATMIGRRLIDDFNYLKDKFKIPVSFEEFARLKNATYQHLIQMNMQEMPGLTPLLNQLQHNGLSLAVASGSIIDDVKLILDGLKIIDKFKVISTGDEIKNGKPHPEIYQLTAQRLDIKPIFCVAIEDSNYGVRSAKSAGMKCIAMPHKYTAHQDFSLANFQIKSLHEITPELLNAL